ncbi:hypothetical protein [Mycobacterium sp. AZCC_0083]|uniref:hypothetical protein n=1 Tax=Mycobacterium sp. AZCC_0083 TaxID=2735882 RepID=UPI00160C0D70|nr:hypothetical protein [Mycobacterium sp. AZCC_0083]MBB5167636.1 hypothetical protein [Mycobacterium sp. AZCC_0083]
MIPPLWLRMAKSAAVHVELLVVTASVVVAPLGWLGGRMLKHALVSAGLWTLRAYPIAALLWAGGLLGGVVLVFYDPAPTLGQVVLMPWLCVQVAAVPASQGCTASPRDGWRCRDPRHPLGRDQPHGQHQH